METREIMPGQVIKFKRCAWDKRFSAMIVDVVDGDFLIGRAYHLGHGVPRSRRVVLYVGSETVIEGI